MWRVFNGTPIAGLVSTLVSVLVLIVANALPGTAHAESAARGDGPQWVPAISAFGGLVSAGAVAPEAPADWAGPEESIRIGDTIEVIQVIMLPESVAVAAGVADDVPRFVREATASGATPAGSDAGERWVRVPGPSPAAGSQHPDGRSVDAAPTDAIEGDDLFVPPPAQPTGAGAPAEDIARDETERWVPSFAIFSGVIAGDVEADVSSSEMAPRWLYKPAPLPPPFPELSNPVVVGAQLVRPPARGDQFNIEPFIGGNLELMTPGLQKLPGRPRFYVSGEASWSFGFDRDVAKEGSPGEMIVSEELNIAAPSIEGQGSRSTIDPGDLVIGANAGMAFTVDIGERRFRIKPNVGYLRQEVDYSGSVNRAIQIFEGRNNFNANDDPPIPNSPPIWQLIKIEGKDQETYHSIGPGLEIEFDAARAGPFMLTLYATGSAYRVISGERKISFEGEGTWEDFIPPAFPLHQERTETAEWNFERDPWSYRGAVGLRFRWAPE